MSRTKIRLKKFRMAAAVESATPAPDINIPFTDNLPAHIRLEVIVRVIKVALRLAVQGLPESEAGHEHHGSCGRRRTSWQHPVHPCASSNRVQHCCCGCRRGSERRRRRGKHRFREQSDLFCALRFQPVQSRTSRRGLKQRH